jgi:uncharacterized protein (TIGR02186 family)
MPLALLLLCGLTMLLPSVARAQDAVVADLSRHLVAITTGFSGADVLLFGAVEGEGDVIVAVRGPSRDEVVRRKDRELFIWMNRGRGTLRSVPAFYWVASTRPLQEIATVPVLARYKLGLQQLDLNVQTRGGESAEPYREAFLRLKQRSLLYVERSDDITFLGGKLFRTDLHFPSNVPTGTYFVETFLFRDGQVVSAQTTPLVVSKVGVGADISDFARKHSLYYGILAVLTAAAAGWISSVAFRRS